MGHLKKEIHLECAVITMSEVWYCLIFVVPSKQKWQENNAKQTFHHYKLHFIYPVNFYPYYLRFVFQLITYYNFLLPSLFCIVIFFRPVGFQKHPPPPPPYEKVEQLQNRLSYDREH